MSWRHVFDSNHRWWRDDKEAAEFAFSAGYKFFAWNGRVLDSESMKDTGLTVEDLT